MNIDKFLEKFRKALNQQEGYKDVVVEVIKNCTGIEIERENIKIKKETLFLNVNSYIRSEIFLYKNKLLEEFKIKIIGRNVKDIK